MFKVKFLSNRIGVPVKDQEVPDEDVKTFVSGFITGQNCFTVDDGQGYDRDTREYYWYYLISLGTYGENFYGVLSLKTFDYDSYRKIYKDMKFIKAYGVLVDKEMGITVGNVRDGFNCSYVRDNGVNVEYVVKERVTRWGQPWNDGVYRREFISDRYGNKVVDEYFVCDAVF